MKHRNLMRQLAAGALALTLAVGLAATPALAAGNICDKTDGCAAVVHDKGCPKYVSTNTVKVNGAVPGAEYKLYKLLQLERTDEEKDGNASIKAYRYSYGDGNSNTVTVKYGHIDGVDPGEEPPEDPDNPGKPEEPDGESPPDETKTYTYEFSIDKFALGDETVKLAGAKFQLIPYWIYAGNADRIPVTGDAESGYSMTVDNPYKSTDAVKIENASGLRMPDTGGIGTTVFYIGGGLMMAVAAGAGVIALRKRRDGGAE